MNDLLNLVAALIAGLLLGALFFGGLWWTVKKAVASKTPALLFLGSFLFRVSITLLGFYYLSSSNWQRMLACLVGFIAARFIVLYLTKSYEEKHFQLKKEAHHEA